MANLPLVSVIVLCYNHERFVMEAIQSVLDQTYPNVEIIVVDDFSTDSSVDTVQSFISAHSEIKFINLQENIGNCRAFNKGFEISSGEYIIDLAADDILLPKRIERGINAFKNAGDKCGVNFTNAAFISEQSELVKYFYPIDEEGRANMTVPEGDLYVELIQTYLLASPTMMTKREVFEKLNGYDGTLAYEDFDFWVRSSRYFSYCYTDEVLFKKRIVEGSMSSQQYKRHSEQMISTLQICYKIKEMNQSKAENSALKNRIYSEMRQCIKYFNWQLLLKYFQLLIKL